MSMSEVNVLFAAISANVKHTLHVEKWCYRDLKINQNSLQWTE